MFIFENLLRNEYFPEELPPCFNSESLADKHKEIKKAISEIHYKVPSLPMTFSGFKGIQARRKFSIPNPYHYCKAVEVIVNNSEDIFDIFNKNNVSLTRPLKDAPEKNEPYKKLSNSIDDRKRFIEELYQTNMFEIRIDINSFFDNIYTHSIPWAIHTKAIAKKDKSEALYGNILDSSLRAMNYGQTNGILVGNAVSRIVSEIILCRVDEVVHKRLPDIKYKRYRDDYYIYTENGLEINNIVSIFRQELAKYGLNLNENKTQIYESPFTYEKVWVEQMRGYLHLQPDVFLSKTISEYNKYQDIAILKYGLKVIQYQKYSTAEWKQLESRLINVWVKFPFLSSIFINIFKSNEKNLRILYIRKAIYSIIDNNLRLKNDQEVIWAVWIAKAFRIKLSQPYIDKILASDNWLAIIIMLDIINNCDLRKSETIKLYLNNLYDRIVEDFSEGLDNIAWTELWLLAYEVDKNKWLNIDGKTFLFARKNEFFNKLRELCVEFYDSQYEYELSQPKSKKGSFITRKEFDEVIKRLQHIINNKVDDSGKSSEEIELAKEDLIDIINDVVSTDVY